MKKSILAVAVLLTATTTFAQEEKQYLPESGDWAIGIEANPFLNYLGNFIGGSGLNSAPSWQYLTNDQRISGKYFASEDMAYRASIRLGFSSMKGSNMIGQDGAAAPTFPNLPTTVEDSYKQGSSAIGLSGGIEYRKNHGRLVGFYGGELGIAFTGATKTTYSYGNAMTTTGAGTSDFSGEVMDASGNPIDNTSGDPVWGGGRLTEDKRDGSFGLGLRGFIGVEYFVLPRVSVGGEFGWGLVFMSNGASSETWETTDGAAVATITHEGTKSSSFSVDTDNNNTVFGQAARLGMTFYF